MFTHPMKTAMIDQLYNAIEERNRLERNLDFVEADYIEVLTLALASANARIEALLKEIRLRTKMYSNSKVR